MICIDPGHGGRFRGAISGWVREDDVVLDYARTLRAEMQRRGHKVVLTRSEDRELAPTLTADLAARAAMANEAGAVAFVSLHCNASPSPSARGAWLIHAAGSVRGKALARAIYNEFARIPEMLDADPAVEVYPDESPPVDGRRLAVLRKTRMPAVLVELGFLTHAGDRARLLDCTTRAVVAGAIADGLAAWLRA